MGLLDPVFFLTPGSLGSAIEVTVASISSPTELNSLAATQNDIVLARTTEAGTGTQTWYYADTTSDAQSLPYIVSSATAGVKFIAFGGRYTNEALGVGSTTASTTKDTGALVVEGGVGVEGDLFAGATLNATSGLNSGDYSTSAAMTFKSADGSAASITFRTSTNTAARWEILKSGTSHVFRIAAYDSSGTLIDVPFDCVNAAGGALTLARPTSITSSTASTTTATGALIVTGGAGIGGAVNSGGDVVAYKAATTRTLLSQKNSTTSTTIGDKDCRLIFQADSGTVGAGGDIVWIATSDTGVERWAAITGGITANSGSGAAGDVSICTKAAATDSTLTTRLTAMSSGSIILGSAALATTATDGFLYVAACAGAPTGVPTAVTGRAPIVVDSTNNKLYFYSGGAWRDAGP